MRDAKAILPSGPACLTKPVEGPLNPKLSLSSTPLHLPVAITHSQSQPDPLSHTGQTQGSFGPLDHSQRPSLAHRTTLKNSQSSLSKKNPLVVSHTERNLNGLAMGVGEAQGGEGWVEKQDMQPHSPWLSKYVVQYSSIPRSCTSHTHLYAQTLSSTPKEVKQGN